jgi:hypothetical protein
MAAVARALHHDEMSERELAIIGLHSAVILAGLKDPWPIRQSLERSVAWLTELGVTEDEMQATIDLSSRMLVAARDSG